MNKLFSLRIWLAHSEYEEEVINSLNTWNFLEIINYHTPKKQLLMIDCKLFPRAEEFLFYSVFDRWTNSLSELITDFELEGVFFDGKNTIGKIELNEHKLLEKKSLLSYPNSTQAQEIFEKRKVQFEHILRRDGKECFICQKQINIDTMSTILLFKPDNRIEFKISPKEYKGLLSVGICLLCQTNHLSTVHRLSEEYVNNKLFKHRLNINSDCLDNHIKRVQQEAPQLEEEINILKTFSSVIQSNCEDDYQKHYNFLLEYQERQEKAYKNQKKKTKKQLRKERYQRKRAVLLERDNTSVCCWCGEDFTQKNFPTFDHLIPKTFGGTDIKENLLVACKYCNSRRGHLSSTEWLKQNQNFTPNFPALFQRLNELSNSSNSLIASQAHKQLDDLFDYFVKH